VRSGSGFWAAGHDSSHGSSAFSASQMRHLADNSASSAEASGQRHAGDNDSGDDSDGTEIAGGSSNDGSRAQHGAAGQAAPLGARGKQQQAQKQRGDDVGAHDAFIAGMIYALSRRLLPGAPYSPGLAGVTDAQRTEGGRWKLDECLRCA